jgi:predicted nucleic acid-binding protein
MNNTIVRDRKVLIDTSVWLAYFANSSSHLSEMFDEILSRNAIYVPKIVLAELIQMASSDHEIHVIEDFIDAFHIIDHRNDAWIRAARLFRSIKKKAGNNKLSLRDCYLSIIAQDHGCHLFTCSENYDTIAKTVSLQLIQPMTDGLAVNG